MTCIYGVLNCALLAEFDETLLEKEKEITQLTGQLAGAKQRLGGRQLLSKGATEQAWSLTRIPALLYQVQQSHPHAGGGALCAHAFKGRIQRCA